ncbi:MAG: hypothetical protein MUP69_05100 [Candidatus Atribacteria bacterium]|nr:hypothetical protein [Candidatus Atribacteria bacterium]
MNSEAIKKFGEWFSMDAEVTISATISKNRSSKICFKTVSETISVGLGKEIDKSWTRSGARGLQGLKEKGGGA